MTYLCQCQLLPADKKLDYNPFSSNVTVLSPELFGLSDSNVKTLFQNEIDKILVDGPSNRFWNLFLDFLPLTSSQRKTTTKHNKVVKPNQRRIFTRQSNEEVKTSPLKISAQVQLALQSSEEAREIDAMSSVGIKVSSRIARQLSERNFDFNPADVLASIQAPNELCPFKRNIACNPNDKFSSFDGSCNNLQSPWLGKANTPYKRYHEPAYDDRINTPRSKSVLGGELPNPRSISRVLFTDNHEFHEIVTHVIATFGQFLTHDITSAAVSAGNLIFKEYT